MTTFFFTLTRPIALLSILPCVVVAFSTQGQQGWRVALNVGRESFTAKNPAWAASGARMPVVVECEFDGSGKVIPRRDYVSFTGPSGEEIFPVKGGEWKLKNERELEFSLEFPEQMNRRDVSLGPGTVKCQGMIYGQDKLKELNEQFYQARDQKWKAGEQVNAILDRQQAPKKWDESQGEWVARYPEESILTRLASRAQLFVAQQKESLESTKRPNPKYLSLEGRFPGVKSPAFMYNKDNKLKEGNNGPVIGSWSAEPITNTPVSYRGS